MYEEERDRRRKNGIKGITECQSSFNGVSFGSGEEKEIQDEERRRIEKRKRTMRQNAHTSHQPNLIPRIHIPTYQSPPDR